jgi:hypothetical protein
MAGCLQAGWNVGILESSGEHTRYDSTRRNSGSARHFCAEGPPTRRFVCRIIGAAVEGIPV